MFGWRSRLAVVVVFTLSLAGLMGVASAWTPVPVASDPLLRMPGSQPGDATLEPSRRCAGCHESDTADVHISSDWQGSMMAQAMRDPLFWASMAVAAQDSIWALGNPNAADLCLRCHSPPGWLGGRSDPTNGSSMTADDFDGVSCDSCHRLVDPFFEDTYAGLRDSGDWDEASALSSTEADRTRLADAVEVGGLEYFDGAPWYGADDRPLESAWTEAASGQFVYAAINDKRASFADARPRHNWLYSRFHKSRHMCGTCHDVSNPVLHNRAWSGSGPLPSEQDAAHGYQHAERTFSEFMLSDFGVGAGAVGQGFYDPSRFVTSQPGGRISTCQDCHMNDTRGLGCDKAGVPLRPDESVEHVRSGQPRHDLTGGNVLVPWLLASTVPGSPVYDPMNEILLGQGASLLTMVLDTGEGVPADALLAGAMRSEANLTHAARLEAAVYDPTSGALSLRVRNDTGHKLISGYPEGRRMWLNLEVYSGATLLAEVNPYDVGVGTLRGLDPAHAPSSPSLSPGQMHRDALVYEVISSSTLTGEAQTFHFALADGRYKDNRIPPRGFRVAEAAARLSLPVAAGVDRADLFTAAEYAGGYDDVDLVVAPGGDRVEVRLYYQTTSREYVEFLRDELNGTATTLTSPTPAGEAEAYVAQTDPFFAQLAAWGDTIFDLWDHNKDVPGAAPILMAQTSAMIVPGGCAAPGSDGTPCDDGDLCTSMDRCAAGTCVGGAAVMCPAPSMCEGLGVCDPASGVCGYAPLTGTACDDRDACTMTDICDAGSCVGSDPVACTTPPECHGAGVCQTSTGLCAHMPLLDGAPCVGGLCVGGACVAAPMDAGVDAAADGSVDAGLDSGSDAGSDGGLDSSVDASSDGSVDASSDGSVDASFDGSVDASSDSSVDASFDGGVDATVDASFDGGVDATVDASADARADAATDAGPSPSADGGCGCRTAAPRDSRPGVSLLALLSLVLARRRRS